MLEEKKSILGLMVKDHCKIEKLLKDIESSVGLDYDSMTKYFYKLEWTLEKHIFTEEKAIFMFYNPNDVVEGYKMLPKLTSEHNEILNKLDLIRKAVRNKNAITGIYAFKEFLIKHKEFEEKDVYPKLDEELSDKQKQIIFSRISEIV